MERKLHGRATPAPYGSTCVNCARAKRKCLLRTDGSGCERCVRLKAECSPSSTVRKKCPGPGRTRVACLEQKIDRLVSLLESRHDRQDPSILPEPSAAMAEVSGSYPYTLPEGIEPSARDAELIFRNFRNNYLKLFPFIHLEDGMDSQKLRQNSPFLWACIIAVTSTNINQQDSLDRSVREIAAQEVIVEGKRTVDLLLGLLCYILWGQFRFSTSPVFTVFSHLCTALTLDLEVPGRRPGDANTSRAFPHAIPSQIQTAAGDQQPVDIQNRRTALACYFVTSCAAMFRSKTECMTWSPYLEECLSMIHSIENSSGDILLVYMVKLQRTLSKVTVIRTQMKDTESEQSALLVSPYISSLNAQLTDIRRAMPPFLARNTTLRTMILYTEICINELILMRLRHVPLSSDPDTTSMEALITCLTAAKSAVEIMSNFELADYGNLPFFLWKQFRHAILTLARLGCMEDPAWDVKLVRRTVNLPSLLEQITENLRILEISTTGRETNGPENVFSKPLAWVNAMRTWLESAYDQPLPPDEPATMMTSDGEALLSEQAACGMAQQLPAPDIEAFTSLDEDLFGGDFLGWWPHVLSDGGFVCSDQDRLDQERLT
ncbi:hypothetical protein BDV33DRAFT_5400 [Aspergillus novoparasiticus]|uniref:Zn(2)-C6 fungal-type domain-containing protein n=1 Tax=Aspergillus novoparasiticus TaxID=986946 RepID=A0A5N6F3K2_9EURO|nr:hypothetical protein BDV33DRAFT_5400 [Aspergillus novoparasiticus]